MPSFLDNKECKIIQNRYVVMIGRHGVGKSHYLGCLLNEDAAGFSGLRDGILEIDLKRFNDLIITLKETNGARLSTIFFCVKWGRFTEVDKNAINFVKDFCSKEMHEIVHIIVTHTPKEYLDDNESLSELRKHFEFLNTKDEDTFQQKFSFVDLLPPHVAAKFQQVPEATAVVRKEWIEFRNHLLEVIESSHGSALARKLKKTDWIEEMWHVHRIKIIIMSLVIGVVILAIGLSLLQSTSIQLQQERDAAQQQAQHFQEAFNAAVSKGGFWKGLLHWVGINSF